MASEEELSAQDRATLLAATLLEDVPAEGAKLIGGTVRYAARQQLSADRIKAAVELAELSGKVLLAAVAADRSGGASWSTVGNALGTSRSAAHGRFAEAVAQYSADDDASSGTDGARAPGQFGRLRALWDQVAQIATKEQRLAAIQSLVTAKRESVIISGPAGTGKSHVVTSAVKELQAEGGVFVLMETSGGTSVIEMPPAADLDVTADSMLVPLEPIGEVSQRSGRANRTEERLAYLEAQLQLLLDWLPERPVATPEPDESGLAARS
ncbi:hypothetical protein ACWDD9_43255 [Kitasatospora sp. NPDC001119]